MKKLLLSVMLAVSTITATFAQEGYGKFALPHTTSIEKLQQYIGQRVTMFDHDLVPYGERSDFERSGFDHGHIYKIVGVKVTKKFIILSLEDKNGIIAKLKICINGHYEYGTMESCSSLLLIDKYNQHEANIVKEYTNKELYNTKNEKVAIIRSVEFPKEMSKYAEDLKTPKFVIESLLDGTSFTYDGYGYEKITQNFGKTFVNDKREVVAKVVGLHEKSYYEVSSFYNILNLIDSHVCTMSLGAAESVYSQVGTILEHPRVTTTYQITGIAAKKAKKKRDCKYRIKDLSTNRIDEYYMRDDMVSSVFSSDLSGKYISVLTKVEKPANPSIRYGKTSTVSEGDNITRFSYVDNVIDIIIFGSRDEFSFVLKNISSNSIKVVWNEAVFVGTDGSTSKVMHAGTKYSQREGDQPASTVIKGAKLEDIAVPTCNVRYSSILSEWVTDSMYPSTADLKDQQVRLMLPIQIKETINEYIFVFDLKYIYNHPEKLKY